MRSLANAWMGVVFFAAAFSCARAHAMNCTITGARDVLFGDYNTRAPDAVDTTGTVSYECRDVTASDTITITIGRSQFGGFFPRRMAHGAQRLDYNLFVDGARTRVWGDGTGATSVYTVRPPDGQPVSVPIFARLPARQNVGVGAYGDTLVLTILY